MSLAYTDALSIHSMSLCVFFVEDSAEMTWADDEKSLQGQIYVSASAFTSAEFTFVPVSKSLKPWSGSEKPSSFCSDMIERRGESLISKDTKSQIIRGRGKFQCLHPLLVLFK